MKKHWKCIKKVYGKIDVISKVKTENEHDLSLAYSPGVAEPCRAIAKNPEELNTYTARGKYDCSSF